MAKRKTIKGNRSFRRRDIPEPILDPQTFLDSTPQGPSIKILPDVNVMKIGGQSIIDRGRGALYPLLEEIVANKERHKMLLCTGGGTRARHAYEVAMDLELPTGVIAAVGQATPRQNSRMLQMLLAKHGGLYLLPDDIEKLPLYFSMNCLPISSGMPPYEYWEKPPTRGRIPPNRTDSGTYLIGEFLGARSVLYVKDEDGLYSDDPKKKPNAKFIPDISVRDLLKMDLGDLVIERVVLENMLNAKNVRSIQIINGLKHGTLTRALDGEHVGTIIHV